MIIKMLISFDYDPETNEYTPLKQEIIKEKTIKKESKADLAEDSAEPQLTLESNKYTLNKAAAELLNVKWEDRLDIKYQKVDNVIFPIIGKSENWGTKSGNKLTKNLTVSCRGNANELLAKYGDTFSITPWKDHNGLFVLVGNADREEETTDDNIVIKENSNIEEDLPLDTSLDEEAYEINDFSFEI